MTELKQFDLNRTFGVEIEAFGADMYDVARKLTEAGVNTVAEGYNHDVRGYWKVVTDSSVVNNQGSSANCFELVSPPLKGAEGLEQVRKAGEVLTRMGIKVNKSTGLHVHHDARDFNKVVYFKNLVKLYGRMEKMLDEAMPNSRRGNNNRYCGSINEKLDYRGYNYGLSRNATGVETLDACETAEAVRSWMGTRYMKVNLECFWRQGTIEVRHHSGTVDPDKLVNWVVMTQLIIRKARTEKALKYEKWDVRVANSALKKGVLKPANELGVMSVWSQCDRYVQDAICWLEDRRKHFARSADQEQVA